MGMKGLLTCVSAIGLDGRENEKLKMRTILSHFSHSR